MVKKLIHYKVDQILNFNLNLDKEINIFLIENNIINYNSYSVNKF